MLASSILILLILLEAGARIYLFHFADESSFLRYASLAQLQKGASFEKLKASHHRYLGYYATPNYEKGENRHNSMGYRGEEIRMPKPDGEFRIVCLGGSTTYTGGLENYKVSYPYLLEKRLNSRRYNNVRVINAGMSGWSSWESLINFELRVLDLDPDMIIVYHGINDIHARLVWPFSAYKGDNSGRRAVYQGLIVPSIFEYSTLLRILMIRLGMTQAQRDIRMTIDRPPGTYYGIQFQKQKRTGVYPEGIFVNVSAKEMLKANPPKHFERNIRNIIVIANSKGITTVLTSFAYSPLFAELPRVASEEYISAFAEMNNLVKRISEEMNVPFFDFASVFPTDKRYYLDGQHVTEAGAKLKAEFFADYLIKNHLLPLTTN